MSPRITKNMLLVLERLYRSPGNESHVHMTTVTALLKRGLITVPRGQRTWGGNFPHEKVILSDKGRSFCKRNFGALG